ncbi:apoptosis antagonizing transcription factor-domain-containing protein [Radiomyces spectabilis]|uniref:apoptosis antagonizing transcription factor-domain-containing protein n=1 Tax=Radiomyces spectabilis TaxID=64574 RepID=UPI002220E92C|nr:apoptosis antagonizing transcription factor-domain-containing protein [Radiomyces spectabilis]KAI8365289.1 apoptosis antagonizing transcription factor-domain-containing protein [Radiomyces spectabilis]
MPSKKSLADEIADLDITAPKDFDPEDITEPLNDHFASDDEGEENDDSGARDHYVSVGKSALRNQQFLLDDPRYSGKRTSRKELYSSDEEVMQDDWKNDNDDDDDELSDDDELELALNQDEASEVSEGDDMDDQNDDYDDDDVVEEQEASEDEALKDELRKIEQDERQMISQISKSAQSDVEKGKHVRQQLTLWENFLESRIRVQKMVDVANQLPQHDTWAAFVEKEDVDEDLAATKEQLREVTDELMELRTALLEQNDSMDLSECSWNSRKRHLDDDDDEGYLESLWQDISEVNNVFVPFRNSTLEKWSNKVQAASGVRLNKKFKAFDQNIMTQIDHLMADKANLVKRTQLQRSDYPVLGKQVKNDEEDKTNESESADQDAKDRKADRHLTTYDEEIFDDHDFYSQLLRELIESRMVDTEDPIAMGMRWAARKQAEGKKKKKAVDTKASKGRKLRFNVHEKIQNFMAPIPAGTWHEEMTDELFSSLLGQRKTTLGEEPVEVA